MRQPWTFWRHVALECARVVALTTAIVVTIASFGAMVGPLSHGQLGPIEGARFMLLAMVPMLQYALPFAGGFGTTMAYHRLLADNEVLAAHAGGLSHRAILAPALATGLVLAGTMSALSEAAIPMFLRSMERLVASDVAKLLLTRIENGESLRFEGWVIHADSVKRVTPDPRSGAFDAMVLRRVVALRLDEEDRVAREVTADSARVWFFNDRPGGDDDDERDDGRVVIWMELGNVLAVEPGTASASSSGVPLSFEVPGMFADDPKFFTTRGLIRLRTRPEEINYVDHSRRSLAHHMGERLWTGHVGERLAREGDVEFLDELGRPVALHAGSIAWESGSRAWRVAPGTDGRIEVRLSQEDRVVRLEAEGCLLATRMGFDPLSSPLTVHLTLDEVRILDEGGQAAGAPRKRVERGELTLAEDPVEPLLDVPALELLARAEPLIEGPNPDEFLVGPVRHLRREIDELNREITSKQHERIAASIACFLMVAGGGVIALRLAGALPLTVYLWSFLPAVGTIMATEAGQELTASVGSIGLGLLYSGVACFAAYALATYAIVRRR